jgi:hypothetical protein
VNVTVLPCGIVELEELTVVVVGYNTEIVVGADVDAA